MFVVSGCYSYFASGRLELHVKTSLISHSSVFKMSSFIGEMNFVLLTWTFISSWFSLKYILLITLDFSISLLNLCLLNKVSYNPFKSFIAVAALPIVLSDFLFWKVCIIPLIYIVKNVFILFSFDVHKRWLLCLWFYRLF